MQEDMLTPLVREVAREVEGVLPDLMDGMEGEEGEPSEKEIGDAICDYVGDWLCDHRRDWPEDRRRQVRDRVVKYFGY